MATPAMAPLDNVLSTYAARTISRFKRGYLEARFVNAIGQICKIVGPLAGIAVAFFGIFGSETMMRPNPGLAGIADYQTQRNLFIISALMGGVLVGFFLWVWGVLISAYGQHLESAIDGTVNTSPFLTDLQRAEVMRLKDATQ